MTRVQTTGIVEDRQEVAEGVILLRLSCPPIAEQAQPGQFVNIKVLDGMWGPFLRRPFSISNVRSGSIDLLFNVIGTGTKLLSTRRPGDALDVLGPLGKPFGYSDEFGTAIVVGGGLGFAPFPFLHTMLSARERPVLAFIGARTGAQVYQGPFAEAHIATDDGSKGYHGTVVQLLEHVLAEKKLPDPKIFGCGPTPMMRALSETAKRLGIACELSLEGDMACGIGLCQGCPVETTGGKRKYALVCTEGPTFNCEEVII